MGFFIKFVPQAESKFIFEHSLRFYGMLPFVSEQVFFFDSEIKLHLTVDNIRMERVRFSL